MLWLKKLNFMETAKLEMELMKALDAGEDLEAKLAAQKQLAASTGDAEQAWNCLLYTSPSPRDATLSRMPSSA